MEGAVVVVMVEEVDMTMEAWVAPMVAMVPVAVAVVLQWEALAVV